MPSDSGVDGGPGEGVSRQLPRRCRAPPRLGFVFERPLPCLREVFGVGSGAVRLTGSLSELMQNAPASTAELVLLLEPSQVLLGR